MTAYFSGCPLITAYPQFEFAILESPAKEVVSPYIDGGIHCCYRFILCSVNNYKPDDTQKLIKKGIYESLAKWLREQTRLRNLPALYHGFTACGIKAIEGKYMYQPDIDAGKYQIQCELEYYKTGER